MEQSDKLFLGVDFSLEDRRLLPERIGNVATEFGDGEIRDLYILHARRVCDKRLIARILFSSEICEYASECDQDTCGKECCVTLLRESFRQISFARTNTHDVGLRFLKMELKGRPTGDGWVRVTSKTERKDRRYVWLTVVWQVISQNSLPSRVCGRLKMRKDFVDLKNEVASILLKHGIDYWTLWCDLKDVDSERGFPLFGKDGDIIFLVCVGERSRSIPAPLRGELLGLKQVIWKGHRLDVSLQCLHACTQVPDPIFTAISANRCIEMKKSYGWIKIAYKPMKIHSD
ncbi:MAG TPA: hypothetical protein PLV72_00520 [Candidatus Magasanikbacteria bacterium]|nr:hypothetical protein [Candidatus Magasanikbacteria bacterium]